MIRTFSFKLVSTCQNRRECKASGDGDDNASVERFVTCLAPTYLGIDTEGRATLMDSFSKVCPSPLTSRFVFLIHFPITLSRRLRHVCDSTGSHTVRSS